MARISRQLVIVSQLQDTRLSRQLADFGLTVPQFSLANHLSKQRMPQRIKDLADAMEVKQPAITKMVQKFETSGWVKTYLLEEDRRVRFVEAEPKLGILLGRIYGVLTPGLMACYDDWTDEDLDLFQAALQRLSRWLDINRLETG